jgi:hypothetical protein
MTRQPSRIASGIIFSRFGGLAKDAKTGFDIKPQKLYEKDVQPVTYKKQGAEDVTLHHRNLQDAIRKNQPLNCDCMLGMYAVAVCEMAVESFRKRQYVRWDHADAHPVRT